MHFLLSLYKSLEITVNASFRIHVCGRRSDMLMILMRCFQRDLVTISNLRGQGVDGGSSCHLLRPLPVILKKKLW